MRRALLSAAIVLAACFAAAPSPAAPALLSPGLGGFGLSPGAQCRAAIDRAERAWRLPAHLLAAIGRVESGRRGPDGRVDPWPYSINFEGADTIFESKPAAVAGVRRLIAGGARSIDVGCMQVNLMYHPDAFASLEEAFDPVRNADYAARFLVRLREQTGSWEAATASYHSATPELGGPYAAKVRTALTQEATQPALPTPGGLLARPPPRPFAGSPLIGSGVFRAGVAGTFAPPRLLALGGPGAVTGPMTGRSLAAYRTNPIAMAPRMLRR